MNLSDLVVRAQVGDEEAYHALYQRFRDMALAYAHSILGDLDLAEDARQEAFLSAYCDLQALRSPEAFPGWFRQIVRKHAIEIRRKRRAILIPIDSIGELAGRQRRQDQSLDDRQQLAQVLRVIGGLPTAEREIARLYFVEELPLREISQRTGVAEKTVKSRLHQARARLRQRLMERVKLSVRVRALSGDRGPRRTAMEEAIEVFNREIGQLLKFPSPEEQQRAGDLVCAKGRLLRFLGQAPEAMEVFQSGLTIPALKDDALFRARLSAEMGLTMIQISQYEQAQRHLQRSRATIGPDGRASALMATVCNGLGLCAWGRGDWRKGRRYYAQALVSSRAAGVAEVEAQILNNLALLDWKAGRLPEALEGYKVCRRMWKKLGNRHGAALALMNTAIIEENMGRLTPAATHYRQALKLGDGLRFAQLQAACHTNLGNLAIIQGRFEPALKANARALEIARAIGDRRSEAIALENLVLTYGGLGRPADAARSLDAAMAIAREIGDRERELSLELAAIEGALGAAGNGAPEPELGRRLTRAAAAIKKHGYEAERPRLMRLSIQCHLAAGRPDRARRLVREATALCRRQHNRPEEKRIGKLERKLKG
jgi:RNA polymerase sigma factor (sigma-70 family)